MPGHRKLEVLRLLTGKVRAATRDQLVAADVSWSPAVLAELVREQLLCETTLSLIVPAVQRKPYAFWRPTQETPKFGAISWQGRQRLRNGMTKPTRIYWATHRAVRTVGGIGGKLRQPWQLQHDLGVTSVHLLLRRSEPTLAAHWISEDIYRREFGQRRKDKIADAFLVNPMGQVYRVIEFVGDYSTQRLRDFHRFWSRRRIPYELR